MFSRSTFLSQLTRAVGTEHVLADEDLRTTYETDWTGRWRGSACAVVRPETADQVAEILEVARDAEVAVVPQGGNTGLVGGSIPTDGALLMSLRRLRGVWDIDVTAGEASVAAGTTLAELQAALRTCGQEFAVDFGARDSATVGGMVATNAGGSRVMRYGSMGAQIIGLNAVLADGTRISRMPGLKKDSCGYDLPQMLVGSEGTLGVIDTVRVKTVTTPAWVCAALVGTAGIEDAIEVMSEVQKATDSVRSAEFISADAMRLVRDYLDCEVPVSSSAAYVLFEWAAGTPRLDEVSRAIGHVRPDATAVGEGPRRPLLWRFREYVPEAIAAMGIPHKLDVSLPIGCVAAFLKEAAEICSSGDGGTKLYSFGHLAEGNLHLNVVGVAPEDSSIDSKLLEAVASYGGSISAEHGIGRAKSEWLHLVRTATELEILKRIKKAFDPGEVLNPGVILPASKRSGRPAHV